MSKYPSDSFLPSGALESPLGYLGRTSSMISPRSVPRSMPDYIPSPHNSGDGSPAINTQLPSPSQNHPMSPPKTRSTSAEDSSAAMIEDWRNYAQNLRSQWEGERAHMNADRNRMEEVMAEERAIWDKERESWKAKVAALKELLKGQAPIQHPTDRQPYIGFTNSPALASRTTSGTGSIDGITIRNVAQESGRNADGSCFYAPAPRHPSRTFDASENTDLRVDDIHAPQETAICVTSKELTSSDFVKSPPTTHDLKPIPEAVESIDISYIQPGLEGVSLKATAVDPTFVARVLSPRRSPSKLSPDIQPPPRDIVNLGNATNLSRSNSKDEKAKKTLEVVTQPENRRLTMHAGHTPNHSISKFSFLNPDGESGGATPTQTAHEHGDNRMSSLALHHEENDQLEQHELEEEDQGDRELSGPLGLTNNPAGDDPFLAELHEKLHHVVVTSQRNSATNTPESETGRYERPARDEDEEQDGGPRLKMKRSTNFGRPFGSM